MNTVFVSIPLWFSRNEEQRRTAEQQHWVSIPLWFSRNKRSALWIIPHLVVSIPLWFLRNNPQSKLHLKPPFTFPYHYGSYATLHPRYISVDRFNWFPYHYGSYATKDRDGNLILDKGKFPYHYGSYATVTEISDGPRSCKFPYHYGSYATEKAGIQNMKVGDCFHTTMVHTRAVLR